MRHGPKSDSRDPRIKVAAGLPVDSSIRRPLIRLIEALVRGVAILVMISLAGGAFAVGVALATRWTQ